MVVSGQIENVSLQDVIQVLAHSQESGVLTVEAVSTQGTVIFLEGNIVCAHSSSTLELLVKSTRAADPRRQATLKRIQTLAALAELLGLEEGIFRLRRTREPVRELDGIDMSSFYEAEAMNTGDLLLILATTVDQAVVAPSSAPAQRPPQTQRRYPRYSPTIIKAELGGASSTVSVPGYLTNLSLGGTFFHGEELPSEGGRCELRFRLPDEIGLCRIATRVVWVRKEGRAATRGVGLAFEQMPADTRAKISAFLERFDRLVADLDFHS